jgi:hypothetical protein
MKEDEEKKRARLLAKAAQVSLNIWLGRIRTRDQT